MSHTLKGVTVPYQSIEALRAAVAELATLGVNARLEQNRAPRMYYDLAKGAHRQRGTGKDQYEHDTGRKTADWCIVLDDVGYDVGLNRNAEGVYEAVADFHAGLVASQLGHPGAQGYGGGSALDRLSQLYSKHAAIQAAIMAGETFESCEVGENGEIHIWTTDYN